MAFIVDELISNCLAVDDDLESMNKWTKLYFDKHSESFYKIRSYEVRFNYKDVQEELQGTGYYLNAILDLDYCFPLYKKKRFHLYKLSTQPGDITIFTYKGDWNKGLKQIKDKPEFIRFALSKDQRIYFENVLDVWMDGKVPKPDPSIFTMETIRIGNETVPNSGIEQSVNGTITESPPDGKNQLQDDEKNEGILDDSEDDERDAYNNPISEASFIESEENEGAINSQIDTDNPYQIGCHYYYDERDVAKAVHYFTIAAENDDMDSQYILGTIYFKGEMGEPDYPKAKMYFSMAADQNDADSQNWLGWMYYNGFGVEKDLEMATKWYEVAAKQGLADAQYSYACIHHMRSNPNRDDEKALKWGRRAKKHGDPRADLLITFIRKTTPTESFEDESDDNELLDPIQAKYKSAIEYLKGDTDEKGVMVAIQYLIEASENGHAQSQFELGLLFLKGEHVEKDESKAKQHLLTAFNNGFALAGTYLASIYLKSEDSEDIDKGIKMLKEAHIMGSAKASMMLAKMYLTGDKVEKDVNMAINIYEKLAEDGNSIAQFQMGSLLCKGGDVDIDLERAEYWLNRSANNNNCQAMMILASLYFREGGIRQDPDKAKYWLERAMKEGSHNAGYYLGWMKYKGAGIEVDYSGAESCFLVSAEAGDPNSMGVLGDLYLTKEWDGYNPDLAIIWYKRSAESGRVQEYTQLGRIFMEGIHVTQDVETSIAWFDKAMDGGYYQSYYVLGMYFYAGTYVPVDYERAAYYFMTASEHGDSLSKLMLSKMYRNGLYFEKDEKRALEMIIESDMQNQESSYQLGLVYKNGDGVEKDIKRTIDLFTNAANKGHKKAQYELAWIYYKGEGIPKDPELAERYARMSAIQSYPQAELLLFQMLYDRESDECVKWLERSAEHNLHKGMFRLARELIKGKIFSKDIPRAIALLEQLIEIGHEAAPSLLGNIYFSEKGYVDFDRAFKIYHDAIDRGNLLAASELSFLYRNGRYFPVNMRAALDYALLAGESNNVGGLYFLAREYEAGKYVEKDDGKSFEYCLKAAMMEHAPSMYQVGWKYQNGAGVEKDPFEAFKWFLKSAEQGYEPGEYEVAWCYFRGYGTEVDLERSKYWFLKSIEHAKKPNYKRIAYRQIGIIGLETGGTESIEDVIRYFETAAKMDDGRSMTILANIYAEGAIVKRDVVLARWYLENSRQCKHSPPSTEEVEQILKLMDQLSSSDLG